MRHVQLVTLGLAFTLVGCQLPLNLPSATTPTAPNGGTTGVATADSQASRMGTLRFAVRWPERSLPGFSAQVIPISTETLVFELSNPGNPDFAPIRQELRREAGNTIATTTLHLPEGGGYKATVTAYDANNVAIASNFATNLTVTWGKTTPVPITLDALFAPQITSLGHGHGTPGQQLTISGGNLARGQVAPVVIFPSGVQVPGTLANGEIQATIPQGAGSGQLKVKVDGVTSTSMAVFQEVQSLELGADGAEQGGIRDGDGAIASWLGDTFPIRVVGKDTGHVLINTPALTGWSYPLDGVGTIDANGTYLAQKLGRSSASAHLGNVSGSREFIVAPPAGPIIRPADNTKGIVDHSLTRVGDRWLAAWYVPTEKKIYWQMRKADGTPDGEVYNEPGAWDGFERAVRVSAAPDANGVVHEVCLAYRLTIPAANNAADRNGVVFRALDPVSGAPKAGGRFHINGTDLESDRLLDLASNETGHAIGFLRFDGSKYSHRILQVTFQKADGAVASNLTASYPNSSIVPYSYRDDSLALTGTGNRFVVARHYGTGGGSGPTGLGVELMEANLATVHSSNVLHEQNRVAAVATSGTTTLVASMEISAGGTSLKLYRYDATLAQVGLGQTIADLNIAGSDPLNWPLDIAWSPGDTPETGRFILTYARKVGTFVNGSLIYYSQAMVQAIKPDGTLDGPAYPLAKDSQTPSFAPSAEGGMALWLDSSRSLVMRRVRYRNLP
ncbi:hypothetical protein D3C86_408650 [compost metagenome]